MAIASYTSFRAKVATPNQSFSVYKAGTSARYPLLSSWRTSPVAGVVPTTSTTCVATTVGALQDDNTYILNAATARRIGRIKGKAGVNAFLISNPWTLVDRLVHHAGLSGTVTGAQTTNLPTAALSRYTSGVGVLAALEIYTLIGVTATTFTVSYTNQAGVAGRTSPAVSIGGTSAGGVLENSVGFMQTIPLQVGDTGVRSVESVTLAGSTGTAGNLGITLFRPLTVLPDPYSTDIQLRFDAVQTLGCNMPKLQPDACLALLIASQTTNVSGNFSAQLDIIHE